MADVEIFYTPTEVAELFGVHRMTVWRNLKTGKWKGFMVGSNWRMSKKEVDRIKEGYYNEKGGRK